MPSKSRGLDFRKGQGRPAKPSRLTGIVLPAPDHDVAIERFVPTEEAVRAQKPKIARA